MLNVYEINWCIDQFEILTSWKDWADTASIVSRSHILTMCSSPPETIKFFSLLPNSGENATETTFSGWTLVMREYLGTLLFGCGLAITKQFLAPQATVPSLAQAKAVLKNQFGDGGRVASFIIILWKIVTRQWFGTWRFGFGTFNYKTTWSILRYDSRLPGVIKEYFL